MKNTALLTVAAIVAALSITSIITSVNATSSMADKPAVVAVVNSEKILDGMAEKAAYIAETTAEVEKLTELKDQKQKELKTMEADLELFNPGSEQYEKQMLKLQENAIQFQAWVSFQEQKLERLRQLKVKSLVEKIAAAIETYADDAGIDIVLDRYTAIQIPDAQGKPKKTLVRNVIYSVDALDITDAIIQKLDNEFQLKQ